MTVAEMPAQLINFEVFDTGNRLLGLSDIELPELKMKTFDLSGAGVAGELQMPTLGFLESLELSLNFHSLTSEAAQLLRQKAQDLILYGAAEMYSASDGQIKPRSIKIEVRGLPKGLTLGSFKPAEGMESKTALEVIYLKISIDGAVVVEIDKINYKFLVDGTDYLAQVRSMLNI